MTARRKCDCKNAFQDDKYGKQIRIMNSTLKGTDGGFRCTSCAKERL